MTRENLISVFDGESVYPYRAPSDADHIDAHNDILVAYSLADPARPVYYAANDGDLYPVWEATVFQGSDVFAWGSAGEMVADWLQRQGA